MALDGRILVSFVKRQFEKAGLLNLNPRTILSGTLWILVSLVVPETYSPVLLERRAEKLSKLTGKSFISKLDKDKKKSLGLALKTALTRPWVLLFREPIVLLLSIYMAILYGTVPITSPIPSVQTLTTPSAIHVLRRLPHRLPRPPRLE